MIDPWEKAAECDRALKSCPDREQRDILANLLQLWISVAREKQSGVPDWYRRAQEYDELQTAILASPTLSIAPNFLSD